jgi:Asp-tRNA(Asn)/Glu-tRNA(Gln) amidotransferase A subunit family amidase
MGVPRMYIGGSDPKAKPTHVSQEVITLWHRARADLEALGATIIETDFPLVTNYEDDSVSGYPNNVEGCPASWFGKERGEIISYAWDDFLTANEDPSYPHVGAVNPTEMFPKPEGYIPDMFAEVKNLISYPDIVSFIKDGRRAGKTIFDVEDMPQVLEVLESQRKRDLEDWIDSLNLDMTVFPASGDVGMADLEENLESAEHALRNGVKYGNGNRALRHLGVPTVSVTMGIVEGKGMPVNLIFSRKAGSDGDLLS